MKKVLNIILNILAWIILIIAFITTLLVFVSDSNDGTTNLFGYMPLTVASDSMKPTFSKNDMIISKEIDDIDSLESGDVITFWTVIDGERVRNTHRIREVLDSNGTKSFITRGDNNGLDDQLTVYAGDIVGEWTEIKIPGFGKVMDFLHTRKGFFICIIIPIALFFLFELYRLISVIVESKHHAAVAVDEEEIKKRAIAEYLAEQENNNNSNDETDAETKKSEDIE